MEEQKVTKPKNEDELNSNFISSLGSLTLLGSLIAMHVYDYLKARESKEAEA